MRTKRLLAAALAATLWPLAASVYAQVRRPFRNGSVWTISFIRMKPGMDTSYLNYVATDWKKEQEALKKNGQILSYKVLTMEGLRRIPGTRTACHGDVGKRRFT